MSNVISIVNAFGNRELMAAAVTAASKLGPVQPNQVGMWQTRNEVPADHWPAVVRAAQAAGIVWVTIEVLEEIAVAARQKRNEDKPRLRERKRQQLEGHAA